MPARDPIIGEVPGAFARFHRAMMAELAPATPYEYVMAENLVAIEWDMLQHRRMRNACIGEAAREQLCKAMAEIREAEHTVSIDQI